MIIYLYLKQHNETGLKYFGKTTRNPHTYKGSGLYWLRHLKTHGRGVTTIKVWEFTRQDVCTRFALWFSHKFNIVESDEYANLTEEAGVDGCPMIGDRNGMFGKKHSIETRQKIADARKNAPTDAYRGENNWMFGKCGELHPMYGNTHSTETKEKMSVAKKGKTYEEIYGIEKSDEIRKSRILKATGRLVSTNTRKKLSIVNKGKTRTEESKKNMSIAQTGMHTGSKNHRALKIKAVSPMGVVHHIHGGFELFCKSNLLSYSVACKLLKYNHIPCSGNCVGWRFDYE